MKFDEIDLTSNKEIDLTSEETNEVKTQNISDFEKGMSVAFSLPILIKSIVLLLIASFALFVVSISIFHSFKYIPTTATIVDVEYNRTSKLYYAIYEYKFKGKIVRAKGVPQNDSDGIIIGEKEDIQYNPDNYEVFDIGSTKSGIFIFGMAIVFFIIAIKEIISIIRMYKAFLSQKE